MRMILAGSLLAISLLFLVYTVLSMGGDSRDAKIATQEAAAKAKVVAIRKDRPALVARAVDEMRRAATDNFGKKEAEAAVISADLTSIKDHDGDKWVVTGKYEGADKGGKQFTAPFSVTLQVLFYSLQVTDVRMQNRTYKDGPAAPPKKVK